MKLKYKISILLVICGFLCMRANAAHKQFADSISLGYGLNEVLHTSSRSVAGTGSGTFDNAPAIDVSKSLYGKIAGLKEQRYRPVDNILHAAQVIGRYLNIIR